jgi:O-antigen/teichoic acid export membrane protein
MSVGVGPVLARVYGSDYGPVATLLPILMAGTVPFAVTMTVLTAARIREHSPSTVGTAVALAVAVLVPTLLLTANHGALGAAWGWTIGNTIAAAIALLASRLADRDIPQAQPTALAPAPGITPIAAFSEQAVTPRPPGGSDR